MRSISLDALGRSLSFARRRNKSRVHRFGRSRSTVVERAEPLIQGQDAVRAVVALEVLVMEVMKKVVGLHRDSLVKHHALKPGMTLRRRKGGVLEMEDGMNRMRGYDPVNGDA